MGRLLGQPDPDAVLLVLLARAERDVAEGDEHDDDHQLDVGKIDQRLEQPRLVVENVERLVVHRGDLNEGIGRGHFLDLLASQVRGVEDVVGYQVRAGYVHLPVDDDERDVAFRVDQRREQRAARIDAQVAERGRPDGHLVLLLLSKLARHVVGEQQRRDADHQTEHDDQHAVAEREEGICESFFHGRGLFALGVLLREYPAVAGRVGEQLDGGPHLPVAQSRVACHAGIIVVAHDDFALE